MYTKFNPFPAVGNFSLKVGFQYTAVTGFGSGFAADDNDPINGAASTWWPVVYALFQDNFPQQLELWNYAGPQAQFPAPDLNYHTIEFRWLDSIDEYYLDGQLVASITRTNTVPRPVVFWMGNPVVTDHTDIWTSFKVDYVEVDALNQQCQVPFFWQQNKDWSDIVMGDCGKIEKEGCALTSAAMVFNTYGANTDPGQLTNCVKQNYNACWVPWDNIRSL